MSKAKGHARPDGARRCWPGRHKRSMITEAAPNMMLTEPQQKNVWDGWLRSEIYANYFADLSDRYRREQRVLTLLTLVFSSGAFVTLMADWLPPSFLWVRPVLALLTAVLSLWSMVAQNQGHATDCADLHFRWNTLASQYEALWNTGMYAADADSILQSLIHKEAEISKTATAFPNHPKRMEKWQDHVVRHHAGMAA